MAYTYRQLRPHEKNYVTHDLELGAMVHVLKVWHHYLYGVPFEVYTDYKYLTYLFSQKDLNLRQMRWVEFLIDYNFQIKYHPGKTNIVADTLSRKTQITTTMISVWSLTTQFANWHPLSVGLHLVCNAIIGIDLLVWVCKA